MKTKIAAMLACLALALVVAGFGGEGHDFGKMGKANQKHNVVVTGCASPNAPNGVVDLSKCSNASYLATILF